MGRLRTQRAKKARKNRGGLFIPVAGDPERRLVLRAWAIPRPSIADSGLHGSGRSTAGLRAAGWRGGAEYVRRQPAAKRWARGGRRWRSGRAARRAPCRAQQPSARNQTLDRQSLNVEFIKQFRLTLSHEGTTHCDLSKLRARHTKRHMNEGNAKKGPEVVALRESARIRNETSRGPSRGPGRAMRHPVRNCLFECILYCSPPAAVGKKPAMAFNQNHSANQIASRQSPQTPGCRCRAALGAARPRARVPRGRGCVRSPPAPPPPPPPPPRGP